jgi:hypothetical protein
MSSTPWGCAGSATRRTGHRRRQLAADRPVRRPLGGRQSRSGFRPDGRVRGRHRAEGLLRIVKPYAGAGLRAQHGAPPRRACGPGRTRAARLDLPLAAPAGDAGSHTQADQRHQDQQSGGWAHASYQRVLPGQNVITRLRKGPVACRRIEYVLRGHHCRQQPLRPYQPYQFCRFPEAGQHAPGESGFISRGRRKSVSPPGVYPFPGGLPAANICTRLVLERA